MTQIIGNGGVGGYAKLCDVVADVPYECWEGESKAISGDKVYAKVSAMDETLSTALQPGDNVSVLCNDAGYIDNTVNDLCNYTQTCDLACVALTNCYNDLSGKPTIGNGKLTICRNGSCLIEYCANQTSNSGVNISVPTCTSQLSNDSGYIDNTVNDLQNYTLSSNLCTVATSGKYCDLTGTPTIGNATLTIQKNCTNIDTFTANATTNKTINIPVPTDNCELANSCGYAKAADLCTVATSGKYCDLTGTPTIPTDNCQLANGCGYITGINCSDVTTALGYTPYDSANPSGYTTCTGTLVASDLTPYAKTCTLCTVATSGKYCDLTGLPTIPTDNCQLLNGCGYTTCTGTLVASDLTPYAKCTDVPTDNCQLANGCGYTTCTGTLVASDLTPYAKSCDLKAVATSGCYCDLTGTPTIPSVINTLTSSCTGEALSAKQGCVLNSCVTAINDKIPSVASCSNQLADKCFVNSSINSIAAYFITKNAQGDQFATYAELAAATTFYSGGSVRVPTQNDYTIVASDENHDNATTRYIYQGTQWEYQYTVNETAMTQAQLDALNSGITSSKVSCYDGAVTTVNSLCTVATSGKYCDLSGTPALCTVATSGKYCDLSGTPTIPTDNCQLANSCGYITSSALSGYQLTCNMVCNLSGADNSHYPTAKAVADALSCAGAGDMLASVYDPCNKCSNAFDYCNFINTPTIPTNNNQLTNGCGYTTCTGTLVASDLTPYAKTCDLATVATSGKYCDLTGTPTIPAAQIQSDWTQTCNTCKDYIKNKPNLCTVATSGKYCDLTGTPTIPTNNNQLTNGCGYTTCTGTVVASDLTPYAKTCDLATVATSGKYCDLTGTPTLCTVATSGKYCDLTGKPTIGSATLSICRNCTLVNSFGANATSNVSVNIDVPTDTCQLSNTAGFITGISCSDVTTALGYTPQSALSANTVTLSAAGWSSKTQTVSVSGVTPSNTVFVSPSPSYFVSYTDAGIYACSQGTNSITFTSDKEPTSNINVNIVIFN